MNEGGAVNCFAMKRIVFVLILMLALVVSAQAQDSGQQADVQPERFSSGDRFLAQVRPDSLHVHRLPSLESARVASLFEDEIVQVTSRNLDGSWFEVRRLGRVSNLGWVNNTLIDWDFAPETLPLGDYTTGVTGPTPLTAAPAIGVYLEEAPILLELPLRNGKRLTVVPAMIFL